MNNHSYEQIRKGYTASIIIIKNILEHCKTNDTFRCMKSNIFLIYFLVSFYLQPRSLLRHPATPNFQ